MAFAALTIDLNARLAKFEEDMTRAGKSLDGLNSRASAAAAGLKSAFAAAGAALSVGALASFAKSGIDAADALNDMSARLGVSVKDLASFKLAADQSGTSLDSVGTGIARLSKSIGEAEGGNKQLAKALQSLGITARDPKEAFFQLADAVQKTDDPNKRAALLSQVLGKSYGELVPLLSQGSDALRESAKQSETFAAAMAKLAPDADKFNDQLAKLEINAQGAGAALLTKLLPPLNDVFDRISLIKDLIGAGGLFNTVAITAGTSEISEVMRRLKKEIKETQDAINGEKAKGKDASPFEEKLRSLTAQLDVMKQHSRDAALALGEQFKNYKIPQTPGVPGKPAPTGNGADLEAMRAADLADAWKEATHELAQYQETRDWVAKGDLERDNAINAIAQDWRDAGAALTNEMMTPMEKANVEFGRLQELLDKGLISWETYGRAVFKTQDAISETPAKLKEMDNFAKTAAENIQNSFADFLFDPFDKGLKGMAQGFGDTIKRMIANAVAADLAKKLFGGLADNGSTSGSGWAGSALNLIGSLFGGARAEGGPVTGGVPYLVGERGPEMFVPQGSGSIVPNKAMKGGLVVHQNIVVHGGNTQDMRRAAGQGLRDAYGVMRGAERYV